MASDKQPGTPAPADWQDDTERRPPPAGAGTQDDDPRQQGTSQDRQTGTVKPLPPPLHVTRAPAQPRPERKTPAPRGRRPRLRAERCLVRADRAPIEPGAAAGDAGQYART